MINFKRPKKEDYDFNDNIEGVRYAKDMNDYADKIEEQLRLYNVSGSFSATDVERAYDDGYSTDGEVTFDIDNYR